MLKEKLLPVSIICLAISMVISASIIAKGMKTNGEYVSGGLSGIGTGVNNISAAFNPNNQVIPQENYNFEQTARYLGIPTNKLVLLATDKGSGIPFIKVGTDYIFNKKALDKWLESARLEMR